MCGSFRRWFQSEAGRRSSSASTHANGTETNDSGKMACHLSAGME